MTTKWKAVSPETKAKVLRAVDNGRKKRDITADFERPPSTISTMLSARKKIEDCYANNTVKIDGKSLRPCLDLDVEEAPFSWFKNARA